MDWIIAKGRCDPTARCAWTRKVKAKTLTVAVSAAQAERFKSAIANHRRLEAILAQMRELKPESHP